MDAKKQFTEYNKQIRCTGGGEKPKSPDKLSKTVFNIIPQDFVPYDNQFDDDNNSQGSQSLDRYDAFPSRTTYVTITCISKESNLRPDKKIRSISGPTRLISMP